MINHLLRRATIRPHKNKYWLISKGKADPLYDQRVSSVCSAYLQAKAQDYDAVSLKRLLCGNAFETAIDVIEIISAKTEDKKMYDHLEKARRYYEWAIAGAREKGVKQGVVSGRIEGERIGKQPSAATS